MIIIVTYLGMVFVHRDSSKVEARLSWTKGDHWAEQPSQWDILWSRGADNSARLELHRRAWSYVSYVSTFTWLLSGSVMYRGLPLTYPFTVRSCNLVKASRSAWNYEESNRITQLASSTKGTKINKHEILVSTNVPCQRGQTWWPVPLLHAFSSSPGRR